MKRESAFRPLMQSQVEYGQVVVIPKTETLPAVGGCGHWAMFKLSLLMFLLMAQSVCMVSVLIRIATAFVRQYGLTMLIS